MVGIPRVSTRYLLDTAPLLSYTRRAFALVFYVNTGGVQREVLSLLPPI